MATLNEELNPTRMTPEVRKKLSDGRVGRTKKEIEETAAQKRLRRAKEVEDRRRRKCSPDKFPDKSVPVSEEELTRMLNTPGYSYLEIRGNPAHRYIAEQKLGRELRPGEIVHHIDGNRHNNRPENLWVFPSSSAHSKWHAELKQIIERGGDPYTLPTQGAPVNR